MKATAYVAHFRRLEELEEHDAPVHSPVRVDGRQLVGVLCVLCDSWSCDEPGHLPTKRAVYIRAPGGHLELKQHHPSPHHEGTARFTLTTKGRAAVADYRLTQGKE